MISISVFGLLMKLKHLKRPCCGSDAAAVLFVSPHRREFVKKLSSAVLLFPLSSSCNNSHLTGFHNETFLVKLVFLVTKRSQYLTKSSPQESLSHTLSNNNNNNLRGKTRNFPWM